MADYYAENEEHALGLAREAIANANRPKPPKSNSAILPPRYDAEEMYGIVNANLRLSFDVREIIARIVDDSDFDEFKASTDARWCAVCAHSWSVDWHCREQRHFVF